MICLDWWNGRHGKELLDPPQTEPFLTAWTQESLVRGREFPLGIASARPDIRSAKGINTNRLAKTARGSRLRCRLLVIVWAEQTGKTPVEEEVMPALLWHQMKDMTWILSRIWSVNSAICPNPSNKTVPCCDVNKPITGHRRHVDFKYVIQCKITTRSLDTWQPLAMNFSTEKSGVCSKT